MSTEARRLADQERRLFAAIDASLRSAATAIRTEWKALADMLDNVPPVVDEESRLDAVAALSLATSVLERFRAFTDEWSVASYDQIEKEVQP